MVCVVVVFVLVFCFVSFGLDLFGFFISSMYPKRQVLTEPFVDQMDLIDKTLVEIQTQPLSVYTANKRKQYNGGGRKFNNLGGMYQNNNNQPQVSNHPRGPRHQQYSQTLAHIQAQVAQAQVAQAAQATQAVQAQNQAPQAQTPVGLGANMTGGYSMGYDDYSSMQTNGMSELFSTSYNPPPMIFEPVVDDGMASVSTNGMLSNYNQTSNKLGPTIWGTSGNNQFNDATVWG